MQPFQRMVSTVPLTLILLGGAACRVPPDSTSMPTLTDTLWQLQQIQYGDDTQLLPDTPANYTIEFTPDGELGIRADCNRVLGSYSLDGSRLTIELGPSTLAACPPESIDTEYLQALEASDLYFFQDADLYIDMTADAGRLQFSAAE